jgi:repressor LexA
MLLTARLSGRQQQLFRFIQDYQALEGRPPTYSEMQAAVGISSKSLVRYHLDVLIRNGLLERDPAVARGSRARPPRAAGRAASARVVRVPIVGTVDGRAVRRHAGRQAGESRDGVALSAPEAVTLARALVPADTELFALAVSGNELLDALLRDGDIVVLKPSASASEGELVAARLLEADRVVVRRWRAAGPGRVRLEAADARQPALEAATGRVRIEGSVVVVIRQL